MNGSSTHPCRSATLFINGCEFTPLTETETSLSETAFQVKFHLILKYFAEN